MYSITSGQPGNTKQRPIFQNESESDQDSLLSLRIREIQRTEDFLNSSLRVKSLKSNYEHVYKTIHFLLKNKLQIKRERDRDR